MAALKSLSFIMISALMVAASSLHGVSAFFRGRKALAPAPGPDTVALPPDSGFDFVPLNTKDPKVIALANYAIDQYNKVNKSKLVFAAVFEALYTESAKGTNYGLVIAATDDKKELNDYEVNVLVEKQDKIVTAFKQNE